MMRIMQHALSPVTMQLPLVKQTGKVYIPSIADATFVHLHSC